MNRFKKFINAVENSFFYPVVDVFLAIIMWVGGAVCVLGAGVAGTLLALLGVISTMARPCLCIVAIWGILHYFGVV
jgi:hypothetical protein